MAVHGGQQPRTVLIPVNNSEYTDLALDWYAANLNRPTDRIVLAHVLTAAMAAGSLQAPTRPPVGNLRRLSDRLGLADRTVYVERASAGIGPTLVDIARDTDASLVVMASRDLGSFGRAVLGSVSDYVVHHARLPVVVVRQQAEDSRRQETSSNSAGAVSSTEYLTSWV